MTGQSSLIMREEEEEDEGNDTSDSVQNSKMSFSYWGADKVTIHKPVVKPRQTSNSSCKGALPPLGYGCESSANAKHGTRLLNPDLSHSHPRPASRRTQASPTSRLSRTLKTITRLRWRPHNHPTDVGQHHTRCHHHTRVEPNPQYLANERRSTTGR